MKSSGSVPLAALALVASSVVVLAQDVPLPEVSRQPAAPASVSEECNDPVVPQAREPVAPIVITEQRREPEAAIQPESPREMPVAEAQLPPIFPEDLTAHESMALLRRASTSGSLDQFVRMLAAARTKVAAMPSSLDKQAFSGALEVYSDVQELWTYAMTDPMGAFYNNNTLPGAFSRLARKYPGYAAFIGPYSVTDSVGDQFYPTTETREFLIREADKRLSGVRLPEPRELPGLIAEREPRAVPREPRAVPEVRREEPRVAEERPRVRPPREKGRVTPRPRRAAPSVRRAAPTRKPVVPTERPARAEPREPAVARPEPRVTPPPVTATTATQPPEPPTVATVAPSTAVTPPPPPVAVAPEPRVEAEELPPEERRGPATNVLLLIAFGLIGLAAIALLMRALRSREPAPATIIQAEPTAEKPAAPTDADWIDPETRHWIEGADKTEKPPN